MCVGGDQESEGAVMRLNYRVVAAALFCIGFWVLAFVLTLKR